VGDAAAAAPSTRTKFRSGVAGAPEDIANPISFIVQNDQSVAMTSRVGRSDIWSGGAQALQTIAKSGTLCHANELRRKC